MFGTYWLLLNLKASVLGGGFNVTYQVASNFFKEYIFGDLRENMAEAKVMHSAHFTRFHGAMVLTE